MKLLARLACISLLSVAAGTAFTGCKSMEKPASAAFASVTIPGHTPEQICGATMLEFEQAGYTAADIKRTEMVFEREGSRWDQVAYGSWMTKNVWVRVRASVVPLGESSCRLQCQAYWVRDKGEPLEAAPVAFPNRKSKPYQELLDKVAARMKQQPTRM
jgi:hypothetical protein